MAIFRDDRERRRFLEGLNELPTRFDTQVLAYCLMGNHFHLLLRGTAAVPSRALQHLESNYAQWFNWRSGRDGPLFRGRYHSIPVETDAYLTMAARYIHRNPLEFRSLRSLREYRWSSYPAYLGIAPEPQFLETGSLMALYAGRRVELEEATEADAQPLGGDAHGLRLLVQTTIAGDDVRSDDGTVRTQGLERGVVALIADGAVGPGLAVIGRELLSDLSAEARRAAVRRARRRAREDRRLVRVVAAIGELTGERAA